MPALVRLLALLLVLSPPVAAQSVVTDDQISDDPGPEVEFLEFEVPEGDATVTNGVRVEPGQYPGVVLLGLPGSRCTGTLISPRLILTAGHCVRKPDGTHYRRISVSFWPLSAADRPRGQRITVSGNAVVHPSYMLPGTPGISLQTFAASDLALLRLPRDAPRAAERVTRLAGTSDVDANATIMIVGYGVLFQKIGNRVRSFVSETPMAGQQRVRNSLDRAAILMEGRAEIDGQIVPVAVCFGDSGGPTFALSDATQPGQLSNLTLVGVNSQIDPGPHDFNDFQFTDEGAFDSDRCLTPGIGSVSAGVAANVSMIHAMAAALGEAL